MSDIVTYEIINQAMDYKEYRAMIDELLAQGKTTGDNQSDEMTQYTRMNVQRMNRLDKHVQLGDALLKRIENINQPWIWLVLVEAWCGDVALNLPVIAKMAEASENINLKLILRDQHLDIMDQYLTGGGRSIPKLICLDAGSNEEIGSWGPRPETAQSMIREMKKEDDPDKMEWIEKIQKWYAKNDTREIQSEFEERIQTWNSNH